MPIIILIIATLLMSAWLILLRQANDDDRGRASKTRMSDINNEINALDKKMKETTAVYKNSNAAIHKFVKSAMIKNIGKKREKCESELKHLMQGCCNSSDILILPGFVLQRKIETIGKSAIHKSIYAKCAELYGKKHAQHKAETIMAKMLSYPLIGISISLLLGAAVLAAGIKTAGIGLITIGNALVLMIVYGIYDELCDLVNKRRKQICRQFPVVISKLALLVTSGMIMDRAWKETAYSRDTEVYMEMQKTSEELDNLVSPEAAYGDFINRCSTKVTSKLASAILQNRSKGNAQIGRLLKDMAYETWQERRHMAKRDAEKANSKLMIPTMLLFMAILVMLMVPVAMNFSGF